MTINPDRHDTLYLTVHTLLQGAPVPGIQKEKTSSDGQGVTRVGRICQEQGESRPKYGRWDIRDTVGPSVFPLDQKYSRKKKKRKKHIYMYVFQNFPKSKTWICPKLAPIYRAFTLHRVL